MYLESKYKAGLHLEREKIGRRRLCLEMRVPSKGRDGYYVYQESEEKIVQNLEGELRLYLESEREESKEGQYPESGGLYLESEERDVSGE